MRYRHNDLIVPLLARQGRIPDPCPVEVRVEEGNVYLQVGGRDWQWDRETGKLVGAGVSLCPPAAESGGAEAELARAIPVNLPFDPSIPQSGDPSGRDNPCAPLEA
jgi:hypothetical protein